MGLNWHQSQMSSLLALLLLLLQMSFPTGSLPVVVVDHKDGRKDGNNDGNNDDNKEGNKDDNSNKLIVKLHATKVDPSDGASSPEVPEFTIAVHSDLAEIPKLPEIISMNKTWDNFERQHAFDVVLGQLLKQVQNGGCRDLKKEQDMKQRKFSQVQENQENKQRKFSLVQENQEKKERKHRQEKGDQDKTSGQWQRKWYKRIG